MAPSTIRKAIGAVKDQTSIGIAKVSSNMAPELEVLIVKATSHDDEPASEKHIREILHLTSYSRSHVSACVCSISKRIGKTRDWIVAIKCLMLIQRLLSDGDPVFQQEIMYATRRGTRLLNMSDFRDEAHSNSWDYSSFVRTLAMYLDQKLELMCYERKLTDNGNGNGNGMEIERYNSRDSREERWRSPPNKSYDYDYPNNGMRRSRSSGDVKENGTSNQKDVTPLREMKPERIFGKMSHLQRLLNRFLSCRPTSMAKNSRMILVALYPIVKDSFKLYADICEILAVLLDRFFDMDYQDCVKAFDAYASAAKQIDELVGFYNWCKDTGLARSSEYPEVQTITGKLLETLEEFVRDRAKSGKSPERKEIQPPPIEEKETPNMNEILALPPPESFTPPPQFEPEPIPEPPKPADLVDLREDPLTADDQGNRFALALFSGAGNESVQTTTTTSAWENPAAELGKADWELALVESASNLSNQKADLGGGLDPLMLNGMYDQGMVRQYNSVSQMNNGSASSVILPGPVGNSKTPVLALPAPDGTTEKVGQDPFAASLSFAPPSYVQMSDMEKKQQLLVQEQMVWDQYARNGMQGQGSLSRISGGGYQGGGYQASGNMMPYGMPTVAGYYYNNTQY
ncbi:putative clathrin assembly protein At2g25430 [Impatiens glandulifera]|uniref:putative clathrin assembly protein At2g25430 n=1 Tax=Impatiens glandulifera TaxID=253017 RepID=UPI001FB0774C|nr:putative clathrin assembly protein At2g25430 [Impatiens glandulifera]